VKVGDLVKWTNEFNPDYYGGNAGGLIVKVTHYGDAVGTVVVDVLVRGVVLRWNSKSCEVISESR
jgi:hypothetical protein